MRFIKIPHLFRIFLFLFIITFRNNYAIEIPFSETEIKTEDNHFDNFRRTSPADSLSCPLSTNAWLWHNGKYLFVHFEAEIDRDFKLGKYASKDDWIKADYFRFQLITDIKNYYSYIFYAFPLGNKYDSIRKSNLSKNKNWNSFYDYKSSISDSLWTVLMKIPFKDIRFHGKKPYHWKLILTRYFDVQKEYYSTPFVNTKMGLDYFRKASDININEEISRNRNYYFRPYTIFTYDFRDSDFDYNMENLGLDFSFNPNFSSKMKLSINPDFSDLPLDDEIDIYNMKYAPTFSENRYFFIEDFNAFGTDNNSFYSRHITQPQYALKLTNSAENLSYGFLSTRDCYKSEISNTDDYFNIIAVRPVTDRFSTQFTILNRMNNNYHNEVFHLNPVWEYSNNKTLWMDLNLSLREQDNNIDRGYFGKIGYNLINKYLNFSIETAKMSKNYFADMGIINDRDYYSWLVNAEQYEDVNNKLVKTISSKVQVKEYKENISNDLIENVTTTYFNIESQYNLSFWINYVFSREKYSGNIHQIRNLTYGASWIVNDLVSAYFSFSKGSLLIYEFNQTYDSMYLQYALTGFINKFISYNFSLDRIIYFDVPDADTIDDDYIYGNADLNISFSNNISLTNGLRFNNYEWNGYADHYGIFSNFRWEFRPGCNLFLGYKSSTDMIDNILENEYQQVFLKISYKL